MRKTYQQMIKCHCDAANTLAIIGGKWKLLLLNHLLQDERGFNELSRLLKGITPHTLSKDLKELIEDGLVVKTILQEMPPKTSYALTDKGRELVRQIEDLRKLLAAYRKGMIKERVTY